MRREDKGAEVAKYLFIFNDSPYGSQRAHNGLRLAAAVARKAPIRVFLLGDGVTCALAGLNPAHGRAHIGLRHLHGGPGNSLGVAHPGVEAKQHG